MRVTFRGEITAENLEMMQHNGGQKTEPLWSQFQFELCLAFSREQSTGLATAGATRPLEEVEVRDEMREKEREM